MDHSRHNLVLWITFLELVIDCGLILHFQVRNHANPASVMYVTIVVT